MSSLKVNLRNTSENLQKPGQQLSKEFDCCHASKQFLELSSVSVFLSTIGGMWQYSIIHLEWSEWLKRRAKFYVSVWLNKNEFTSKSARDMSNFLA